MLKSVVQWTHHINKRNQKVKSQPQQPVCLGTCTDAELIQNVAKARGISELEAIEHMTSNIINHLDKFTSNGPTQIFEFLHNMNKEAQKIKQA